jgi:hypothetical protein
VLEHTQDLVSIVVDVLLAEGRAVSTDARSGTDEH